MLHGELLSSITEIEEKSRGIFHQDHAHIRTTATAKKCFQVFGIELLS